MTEAQWRDRFQTLFEIADNPIIILSCEGEILDFNRSSEKLYGRKKAEVEGKNFFEEFVPGKVQADVLNEFKEVLFGKKAKGFEGTIKVKDGTKRTITWNAIRLTDNNNKPEGIIAYGNDVTESREIERKLELSIQEIQDQKFALDQSAIVAITDIKGVITYINDKFVEISRYSREELIGQTHRIINSGYHPKSFFQNLWKTIASGKVWRGEIKNKAKDGTYYWVDTTIVPFFDENKRPRQYVSIRNDITAKKIAEQRIEEERVRTVYAEKMASLGEMAAGIAHELGNPIASISGWLDVVTSRMEKQDFDVAQLKATIPSVREKVERMSKIIRGMLAYARDGSHDPFQKVNIASIVSGVLEYSSYKLKKYGITLKIAELENTLDVECRETEISQVLVNLILNACDAIRTMEDKWIEVSIQNETDGIVISVIDSGPGIPTELANKIMQPFFTTKPTGKGTGLGLSISRSIVEKHNGKLWVDTSAKNTTFKIRLPLTQKGY